MMKTRYELTLTIGPKVIDENGRFNNVVYVGWMQAAAMGYSENSEVQEFMTANEAKLFARRHEIEYLSPLFEGDVLTIPTWIENAARVKSLRNYGFLRTDKLVARGETE